MLWSIADIEGSLQAENVITGLIALSTPKVKIKKFG